MRIQWWVKTVLCGDGRTAAVRLAFLAAVQMTCGAGAGVAAEVRQAVDAPFVRASAVIGSGPIVALSTTTGRLTCIQSAMAVDPEGQAGVLAPQVGATVIRGSMSAQPAVTLLVVARDRVAGEVRALTTVCTSAP